MKLRPMPESTEAILFHTKVYILSDRFNITKLKDLAYSKIETLLVKCGMVANKSDIDAVMEAVTYAFGHLTLSVQKGLFSPDSLNSGEKLLVYMVRYIAWARDLFQTNEAFTHLLEESPEFAIALVYTSRSASAPPWSNSETAYDSTSHILSRFCGNCTYRGIMYMYCPNCRHYDTEVAAKRLSGNKLEFTYTCKWCSHKQNCNQSFQYFTEPHTSMQYRRSSNMNTLVCRRCNMFGCRGTMSMI